MKRIFKDSEGEYRPWFQIGSVYLGTLMSQVIVLFILGIGVGVFVGMKAGLVGDNSAANMEAMIMATMESGLVVMLSQCLASIIGIIAAILFYRAMSKRKISTMGLTSIKKDGKDLAAGLGLGILFISILIGILTLTGDYKFVGFNISTDLLLGLIMFIGVGFYEEILVRGVFQHTIHRKHSIIWAILISSVLFSIMHFENPNIGNMPAVNLFLAGVLFSIITYKTGNLWMAIGIHITWNYTMGNIFGIEVSGIRVGNGLIQMERGVDTALNGGNFGLEGGYLCTILLCTAILVITQMKKRDIAVENDKNVIPM